MDGIIIINKQKGYTSNDVVQIVKRTFNQKVGHTGTLDPMATGVLPILVGKGTSLSKYLINHDKTYEATVKLGIRTETGDCEGKVIEEKSVNSEIFEEENITNILNGFVGIQVQTPPIYSAIKVNGHKLYEYARSGKSIEIPTRKINIYDIRLICINQKEQKIKFEVSCSKGTYIRTLCEDIAKRLETIGYMSDLNRTKVGIFKLQDSITIDKLKTDFEKKYFISIESFFKDNESIYLNSKDVFHFINGVKLNIDKNDGIYKIYKDNSCFIGVGIVSDGFLKRDIVIE